MNELDNFQQLKKRILETYQKSYPYFSGDWKNFSSKDIRQLIDLIEIQLKEKVSEKWIYTHLKPESNDKLPRKDMLDIFSRFVGFSDWNEFVFKNQPEEISVENEIRPEIQAEKHLNRKWFWLLLLPVFGLGIYFGLKKKTEVRTVEIQNQFTKEPVPDRDVEAYKVSENEKIPVKVENSKIEIGEKDEKIVIESPYFEKKEIDVSKSNETIFLEPEDYSMVLKNYIHSDLKDWEDRKEKLDKILSNDLEVIVLLKDNLGAEYLNKKEFSGKLIVPTSETKKMKILKIEMNDQKQINFIRIQQL